MTTPNDGEGTIRFLLDGDVHVVRDVAPTTTVLQYLRDHLRRTGSKEGCAEGDCGACTVVLAELIDNQLRYRAANSCIQFLPTLDGKALLTVESLKIAAGGELHPVQQALIECHGSQCGFCTPGFVMSLYALYKTAGNPSRDEIQFALAGNLCRCTGYRPILAAADRMYELDSSESPEWERELKEKLLTVRVTQEKRLDTADGRYAAPTTVNGLAKYLSEAPDATILAGGTDVGLWVTKAYRSLPDIVYIGNVYELANIRLTDDYIEIGAAVSLTDAFVELEREFPELWEICRRFASPPICNSGTLCGNVANGSPIGDSMPALIALGADVVLRQDSQERSLPLEDFYLSYQRKNLQRSEFVASVRVPRARGQLFRSYKISKRFEQDISSVCAAFSVELQGQRVQAARVCFGGMAEIPKRARACEAALSGAPWSRASVEKAARALSGDFQPITDMRASQEYRALVAANLLKRFYADTVDTGSISVWSYAG